MSFSGYCFRLFMLISSSFLFINGVPSCTDCESGDVTCVDGVCLPRCVNVTSSGECLQCRDSRFYGKQCENICSDTCLNSRCQLNNSRVVCTEGCVAGKKEINCEVDCPPSCSQYYGDYCNGTCHGGCRDGCDRNTGKCCRCKPHFTGEYCESCIAGYRGRNCNETCPEYCRDGCDRSIGQCLHCETYKGRHCPYCPDGKKGRHCNETCPSKCKDNCKRYTGVCEQCVSGYRGIYCNETCLPNCLICDRDNNECDSCSLGYTGKYCYVTCPEKSAQCKHRNDTTLDNIDFDQNNSPLDENPSLPSTDGKNQLMIGVALMTMLATAICLFLAIHLWRRRKRRKSPEIVISLFSNYSPVNNTSQLALRPRDISTSTQCLRISNPTYMLTGGGEDVHHVKMCDELVGEEAMDQMIAEFYKLPSPDIRPTKHGSLEENFGTNRYRDVLPFDETRVSLDSEEDEENDYINASYINGYRNQTTYVAAQGPSLEVVNDFWRMIWQLKTTKIVMLTNLVEAGKVKCEMYWPNCSGTEQYGKVCVKCVGEEVYEDYTLRTLAVWKGKSETRTVRQFHFTAWPDHGVPEETKSVIDFHRVVKNIGPNTSGPMVIHCSAGVERSGTFLAFDFVMDQARHENSVCVYTCVKDIRLQKMKIVQTEIQYKFLYNMLVDALQYSLSRTVHVVCEKCWDKENNSERLKDDLSVEESHDDYGTLWTSTSQTRENINLVPDVFVMLNENNPDLFKTAVQIESTDIQMESTNIRIESTNIQIESANIQTESTNIQMESTDIQMESTDIQMKSGSFDKSFVPENEKFSLCFDTNV